MSKKVKDAKPDMKPDNQIKVGLNSENVAGAGADPDSPSGTGEAPEVAKKKEENKDLGKTLPAVAGADLIKDVSESVLVFRARIPLTDAQFKLLQKHVESEEKRTGFKIVLMPYSCEVGE